MIGVYLRDRNDPHVPAALQQPMTYRELNEWLIDEGLSILDHDLAESAAGKLAGHTQTVLAKLFEPTLNRLNDIELRALEYAALLPPDIVPLTWLRALLRDDYVGESFHDSHSAARRGDPLTTALGRLHALRLLTVDQSEDANTTASACVSTKALSFPPRSQWP